MKKNTTPVAALGLLCEDIYNTGYLPGQFKERERERRVKEEKVRQRYAHREEQAENTYTEDRQ